MAMNEDLRTLASPKATTEHRAATIAAWGPAVSWMRQGLRCLPAWTGTCYRAIPVSPAMLATSYTPGRRIRWSGFTSCSKYVYHAWRSISKANPSKRITVFAIRVHSARAIDEISCFPCEREVLLEPSSSFVVCGDLESTEFYGYNTDSESDEDCRVWRSVDTIRLLELHPATPVVF